MNHKPWKKKDSTDLAAGILCIIAILILTLYFTRYYEILLDGSLSLNDIMFISNHSYSNHCFQDFDYSRWIDPNISEIEKKGLSSLYSIERNNCAKQIFTLWGIEVTIEVSLIILAILTLLHQGDSYHNKVGQTILGFKRSLRELYFQITRLFKLLKISLKIFKPCPYCRSRIYKKASVCKQCLRKLPD